MTDRERLLAILEGRSPDRIPWIPRLLIWFRAHQRQGTLPERFRGKTLREVERELRMGTPARDGRVFRVEYDGVEVVERRERYNGGFRTVVEYITPRGTLRYTTRTSDEMEGLGIEGFIREEHPLKREEDYALWEYIVERTRFVPTYEEYDAYDREIGDDGLPMVATGDCPFHEWLLNLAGYQHGYLHLHDFPETVERLLQVMDRKYREELWPVIADSPARLILNGVHFSSQFTPPHYFSRYITPYYRDFSDLLHRHGKALTYHADNDASRIFGNVLEAGFDMAECFATKPLAECTLEDARRAWGTRVIIWGGLPSVLLEGWVPEEEFEAYMRNLFRVIAPGDAFILGVSDNIMPGALLSRIERVADLVEEFGNYPVRPPD